eukprot:GHVQ01020633.1.p1 GENE.GHVQ01020633.1~~GHVQ01020633.1.p1  ORF type:complete len:304 (+),score=107.01 GHVQ01020633.1:179-1090(+)
MLTHNHSVNRPVKHTHTHTYTEAASDINTPNHHQPHTNPPTDYKMLVSQQETINAHATPAGATAGSGGAVVGGIGGIGGMSGLGSAGSTLTGALGASAVGGGVGVGGGVVGGGTFSVAGGGVGGGGGGIGGTGPADTSGSTVVGTTTAGTYAHTPATANTPPTANTPATTNPPSSANTGGGVGGGVGGGGGSTGGGGGMNMLSSSSNRETDIPQFIEKSVDMGHEEIAFAMSISRGAFISLMKNELRYWQEVAKMLKLAFDEKFGGTWHVIVGQHFGAFVTHEAKHMIYFTVGQLSFLVFKHG